MASGEYDGSYGFRLPKLVSIHREYLNEHIDLLSAATVSDRVVYVETSKNEDTWYDVLGDYYHRYDTIPRVFKGWWNRRHAIHNRNSDGNLYVRYLNWNGSQWNWSNNWLSNDFNGNNPAALSAS